MGFRNVFKLSLQKKIYGLTGLLVGLSFVFIIFFAISQVMDLMEQKEEEEYDVLVETIESRLQQEIDHTRVAVKGIAENQQVRELFAEEDREGLLEALQPVFETIDDDIAQMQFHTVDSESFLRLHMPERYGDSLRDFRETVNEANATRELAAGLERGVGGYGIRVVAPVSYQGEHVGSFELGSDFDEGYLEDLHNDFGGEYMMYSFAEGDEFDATEMADPDTGLLAATVDEDVWDVPQEKIQHAERGETVYLQSDDEQHGIILLPFENFQEEVEGYIKVITDRQAVLAGIDNIRNSLLVIFLVAALAIIGSLTISLKRLILNPIKKMQAVLAQLSNNDLNSRVEYHSSDEMGYMAEDLNQTIEKLKDKIYQIQSASDTVSNISREIANGNQDLSQRTEEQASTLEEIASTTREISSGMDNANLSADQTKQISQNTLETVQEGENAVKNMEEAMQRITQSNQEISEIVNTINEIAFQTNILALNASVEAAQAGEHGRGFAVVASEVRNLANRAGEAAGNAETLIKENVQKVENGNQLMKHASEVLQKIIQNTQKTSDAINEIAASMGEQSSATGEMRKAIDELNHVTQQNASLVEEIASASENMEAEAESLEKISREFKVDE